MHRPDNFDQQQVDPTVITGNNDNLSESDDNLDDTGSVLFPKNTDIWKQQKQINKERRGLVPVVNDDSMSDLSNVNNNLPRLRPGIRDKRNDRAKQRVDKQKIEEARQLQRQKDRELDESIRQQRLEAIQRQRNKPVVPNEEDIASDSDSDSSDSQPDNPIRNKAKREIASHREDAGRPSLPIDDDNNDSIANQMNANLPQLLPSIDSLQQ